MSGQHKLIPDWITRLFSHAALIPIPGRYLGERHVLLTAECTSEEATAILMLLDERRARRG